MPRRKIPEHQQHPDYPAFIAYLDGDWTVEEMGPKDAAVGEQRRYLFYDIPEQFLFMLWQQGVNFGENR